MKLSAYITHVGDERAAKILGITARAARSYRERRRSPRPGVAYRIELRTKRAVTFAECYESLAH